MIKKTFEELKKLDTLIGEIIDSIEDVKETKFGYAIKRFIEKSMRPGMKDYYIELEDIRIDHALTDEKTSALITDKENPRGYKYSKSEFKELLKEERKLMGKWNPKEVKVEPFFCKKEYVPFDDLTEEQIEALTGLVIEGETEEAKKGKK